MSDFVFGMEDEPEKREDEENTQSQSEEQPSSFSLNAGSRVLVDGQSPIPNGSAAGVAEDDVIDVDSRIKPEANMEKILGILRADAASSKNDKTMVFNHDVLAPFAKQINEAVKNQCLIPEVAEAYQYYVNNALHKAVVENYTKLYKPDGTPVHERTKDSLEARLKITEYARRVFNETSHGLTIQLEGAMFPAESLHKSIDGSLAYEENRLAKMIESDLVPATLGETLFMKAQDQFNKIFSNGDLAGDVQEHRNRHINASLFQLHQLTGELKANSGNAEWVKSHGQTTIAETERVQDELKEFTKGFEEKLNKRAFNGQMGDIGKATIDAFTQTDDEDFKKRLKALAESMRAMMERVEKLINRAFNSFSGPKP